MLNTDTPTRVPNNAHQQPTSPDITTISSSQYNRTTWKTIHALNSDHLPILLTIQTDNKHTIQHNRRSYTNYRKADWDKFIQDTEDAFTAIQPPTDIHDANKTFTNILYQAGKKHIPLGRIRNTDKLLPHPIPNKISHSHLTSQNTPQDPNHYTGVKQRDLHPHKHKQDRYLEGTHRKTMGSQTKHKHLLEHNTRSSTQTTNTTGQQLHNIKKTHTH